VSAAEWISFGDARSILGEELLIRGLLVDKIEARFAGGRLPVPPGDWWSCTYYTDAWRPTPGTLVPATLKADLARRGLPEGWGEPWFQSRHFGDIDYVFWRDNARRYIGPIEFRRADVEALRPRQTWCDGAAMLSEYVAANGVGSQDDFYTWATVKRGSRLGRERLRKIHGDRFGRKRGRPPKE
jgi:hypothetical protein